MLLNARHITYWPFQQNQTNSEVATINFIRQNTNIPVPQILAFDDSGDNEQLWMDLDGDATWSDPANEVEEIV
jgi:hypothetical protein